MFDRNCTDILDLAHHFYTYIVYEEEAIFDRFPDADMHEICETMAKEGVVLDAKRLEKKALKCAEDGIYEVGYEGFGPVCKALGIEDDFRNGTELYCIIMALYAKTHDDFRNEALDRIELTQMDFESEDWESWESCGANWTTRDKDDLKYRMQTHYIMNIYGKGL